MTTPAAVLPELTVLLHPVRPAEAQEVHLPVPVVPGAVFQDRGETK